MIHVLKDLELKYPKHVNQSWIPNNTSIDKWYKVVAEKTGVRQIKEQNNKTRKVEDLHLGFINDKKELVFGASFNMEIRICGEQEEGF